MKAILISIQPKPCANILNGLKTKEIRKRFPRDYRGWIYIYCTKDNIETLYKIKKPFGEEYYDYVCVSKKGKDYDIFSSDINLNGKVIARFYCDNVTEYINGGQWHSDNTFGNYDDYIKDNILEQSCLTEEELFAYCEDLAFKSINITKLEIFDTPKELSEFKKCYRSKGYPQNQSWYLTKAPQNLMYIETE